MRERLLVGLSLLLLVEGCTTSPGNMSNSIPATPGVTGNTPPVGPGHPLVANTPQPSGPTPGQMLPPINALPKVQPFNTVSAKPNNTRSAPNTPNNPPLIDNALLRATMIEPGKEKDKDSNVVPASATHDPKRPDLLYVGPSGGPSLVPPPPPREPKEMKDLAGAKDLLPTVPVPEPTASVAAAPSAPANAPVMRMVGTKKFSLAFEMKDAQAGSTVEVWATQDQRTWKKVPSAAQPPASLAVEAPGEGTFGLLLIVKTAGGAARSPKPGEMPHVWIAVDTTKPVVELQGVDLSLTSKAPGLVVRWKATDKNFGPRPITIAYAENADGPWIPLAAGVANSGRHEIPVPAHLPRKMLVRLEAADVVGNAGSAQTAQAIRVELPWPPTPSGATAEANPLKPVPLPVAPPPPQPSISVVDVAPGG